MRLATCHLKLPLNRLIELPTLHNRLRVFRDRAHAAEALATMLAGYRGSNAIVLGIPAGGVPVAAGVARALALELDVAVVSKLTLPWNSEAGYGALAFDGTQRLNEALVAHVGLSAAQVEDGVRATRAKIERRLQRLRGARPFPELAGRTAIVVDDGLASGFTLLTAVAALRRQGATDIVVAVPTAHAESAAAVLAQVEALYCANLREGLSFGVADAYQDWSDVDEDEVARLLAERAVR